MLTAMIAFGTYVAATAGEPTGSLAEKLKAVTMTQFANAPGYSEGPTWIQGDVYFCSGALLKATKDGTVTRFLEINPAGTFLKADGGLLICDNKHKALLEWTRDGKLAVLADSHEGKPLNSLNDLTVDKAGNVYWTDPAGSSKKDPVGRIFRVTPEGVVSQVASGLAFPNGLDVDPSGAFLYVIESQTQKILRYAVPASDKPLGEATLFYDLGGSGGDGCAFDVDGNLWATDFHRPETNRGRIAVLSTDADRAMTQRALGYVEMPTKVVSNITFGGPERNQIFCTTGDPPGVFTARVPATGFAGHPGKPMKVLRYLDVAPAR